MKRPIQVLFIENDPCDAQRVIEDLRTTEPAIQVEWVGCLENGLEYLAQHPVQAILLALSVPDSQGWATLQAVLSRASDTPVVVMTGIVDEELGMRAMQAGAQDYLIKGQVDGPLLTRVIQYAIQRKQAELDLRASEEKVQNIIQHSSSVFYTYTTAYVVTYISPQTRTVLDCEPEEAIRCWRSFLTDHPINRRGIEAAQRAIQTGERQPPYELELCTPKGRRIWVWMDERPVVQDGKTVSMVGSITDITGRKHAEAALEASEKRFRTWIENSSDIITVLDAAGIIQYESPSVKKLLGYEIEELLSKNAFEFVHPEDRERVLTAFVKSIQSPEGSTAAEFRFRHRDGSWRFLEGVGRAYVDEHGEVVGLIHSRDINDRKLADEALKEKERLLTEAQRIGRIGSWSYDIPTDTFTFSDQMYRLLDILPGDFHHNREDFLALVYPSDRAMAKRWLEQICEGAPSQDLNFRLLHKNGELCYLHCTGVVEYNASAQPTRFIGAAQDVTERRVAEIEINQHVKRLTALSEIDHAIMSSFDPHYTLGVILSQVISQLQVDAANILLSASEGGALTYVAGQGFRTSIIETTCLKESEGYAGRVAKDRRLLRVLDLQERIDHPGFEAFVRAEGFKSYIGVPLIVKGKVKGVLEVFHRVPLQPYQGWLDFLSTLAGQAAIAIENAALFGDLRTTNEELIEAYDATIEGWSRAMDLRDRETEGHTQRVTRLTLELARLMNVDESKLIHIRRGALLHDIGKLGVPDHILFKPGKLTVEEWQQMQKHPEYAYEMLAPIPYLKPALNIPYFHHEKWDGTGYPLGLRGEQIPLEARIFALIDVWDALLSDRPYRKAYSREEALELIRAGCGSHFDPRIVECFLEMIHESE